MEVSSFGSSASFLFCCCCSANGKKTESMPKFIFIYIHLTIISLVARKATFFFVCSLLNYFRSSRLNDEQWIWLSIERLFKHGHSYSIIIYFQKFKMKIMHLDNKEPALKCKRWFINFDATAYSMSNSCLWRDWQAIYEQKIALSLMQLDKS